MRSSIVDRNLAGSNKPDPASLRQKIKLKISPISQPNPGET
jgi:hypothetical protein